MATSIIAPVFYLAIVVGGLVVFSSFYRKRAAAKVLEPWFSSHPERDAYVTLLQQSDPPASDALLKAALIRRAIADVNRVLRLREDKPALQGLLQKGSIGDDLWNSCLAAEKETEAEILEVMHEANTFVQGWGQIIFNTAGEMVQNEKLKAIFDDIPKSKVILETKYGKSIKSGTTSQKRATAPSPSSSPAPLASPAPSSSSKTTTDSLIPSLSDTLTVPSSNADAESVASSDGELVSPVTPSKSGRSTPNKGSAKKGKKRK